MKTYRFFALTLALTVLLCACGQKPENPAPPEEAPPTESAAQAAPSADLTPSPALSNEAEESEPPQSEPSPDAPEDTPTASEPPQESAPPQSGGDDEPKPPPEAVLIVDPEVLACVDGIYFEPGKTVASSAVTQLADKMKSLKDSYFPENSVYYAIVPDKSYLARESGAAYYDHSAICTQLKSELSGFTEINIASNLSLSDYYATDPHWRQDKLTSTAAAIAKAMGREISVSGFTQNAVEGFVGTYSQLADALDAETLYYLTDSYTKSARVSNFQKPEFKEVYDLALFSSNGYDIFLSGATPLTTIINPLADGDRELVIFRDSFASSIAPLLIAPYSKITLVDLRYMVSDLVPNYVSFENADVLFLYCDELVGSSFLLK